MMYASGSSWVLVSCCVCIALPTALRVFISTSPLLPTPGKLLDPGNDAVPSLKGRAPLEAIAGPGENLSSHSEGPLLHVEGYADNMFSFQSMVS